MEKTNSKTLWFRIGTAIPCTVEEQRILRSGGSSMATEAEYSAAKKLLANKLLNGGYRVTGECYSPEGFAGSESEWSHEEEILFDMDLDIPAREIPEPEVKDNACKMNELEIQKFKAFFSKYCRGEIKANRCGDGSCAQCPVNKAYTEIFDGVDEEDFDEEDGVDE